ncbi:SDR family oxidoreductase [Microvirga lenta]|uniref:SDR family oxidoreductase n=1 Tax=Microvirga lenta TaxID=2881337 RepID=UPI001CFD4419|nr:SDR family oxidoreductase [Microvirga lenta]MCB5174267.1 SDR family oxidoreductase [Microvirga lenta]
MNLFIFGLGYTARRFIGAYGDRFARISGTSRSPEDSQPSESSGPSTYRFSDTDFDPRIPDQLDAADALLVCVPPTGGEDPVLRRFAAHIASSSRLRWIGYLSTVGVYGDAQGGWIDERSPPDPGTPRSRHRLAAERQWLALGERASLSIQIFRLAGIYGPGRNALQRIADGTAQRIVKPGQVFNRIHMDDIAQVLLSSMERPSRNAIYNVADDEPGPPQDVITYAAHLLGCPPPPEVPFEEADLTPMARSFYEDNKRIRNTRIKTDLGVTLRYPTFRHGLKALYDAGEGRLSRRDTTLREE